MTENNRTHRAIMTPTIKLNVLDKNDGNGSQLDLNQVVSRKHHGIEDINYEISFHLYINVHKDKLQSSCST